MVDLLLGGLSFLASFQVTPTKITRALERRGEYEKRNTEFVAPETVRLASVQLAVRDYQNLTDFTDEMYNLALRAAEAGAQMVVFPAYTGLLAGTMLPGCGRLLQWVRDGQKNSFHPDRVERLTQAFHNCLDEAYMYTFSTIARLLHIYVVGGSTLIYEDGKLLHRCVLFDPQGNPAAAQDKINILGLDQALGVSPAGTVEVVQTPMGKVAMVLASDAYYFECFRIAKAMGADIIACPSAHEPVQFDLLRCRASEENVYIAYACMQSGGAGPQPRAALIAPQDSTPDKSGVVAVCEQDGDDLVCARTSLEKLPTVRLVSEPNPAFLSGDYLHSYRYCGQLPMIDVQEDV